MCTYPSTFISSHMCADLRTICGSQELNHGGQTWRKHLCTLCHLTSSSPLGYFYKTTEDELKILIKPSDSVLTIRDFLLRRSHAGPQNSSLRAACPAQPFMRNSLPTWNTQTLAWIGTWKVTGLGRAGTPFPFPDPLTSFLTKHRFALEFNGTTAKCWLLSTPHHWGASVSSASLWPRSLPGVWLASTQTLSFLLSLPLTISQSCCPGSGSSYGYALISLNLTF